MIFEKEIELTNYKHEINITDEIIKHEGYWISYNKLLEILPLIKFAEKFKNKVELDIKSLIEAVIPKKYEVCEYIAKYLEKYMRLKELLMVKIFGDIDDSRTYHYIKIVPIFESSEKSLEISEELENNIYESPLSNRILVFSIFK
jgi:hypothetical protein